MGLASDMELVWITCVLVADITATTAFTQSDCPRQPVDVFWGGVCYWRSEPGDLTTFFGAKDRCQEQGGDLAVIPSTDVLDALFTESTSEWHYINLYDSYPGHGEEGLPRKWTTSQVGSMSSILNWRDDDQPTGYAANKADKAVKDCVVVRAEDKTLVDKPCAYHVFTGQPLEQAYICSYDPQEPTHTCITHGDCLSNHYQRLHHQYLEAWDNQTSDYGIHTVQSQIECGVSCHSTPGCETLKWNPGTKQCHKLGHITIIALNYTDAEWRLFSRYRFYHNRG